MSAAETHQGEPIWLRIDKLKKEKKGQKNQHKENPDPIVTTNRQGTHNTGSNNTTYGTDKRTQPKRC